MKLLVPFLLIVLLSSCTSEVQDNNVTEGNLLKTYKITRDNNGFYSIDYELEEDTSSELIKDVETNVNEAHFFSGKVSVAKSQNQFLSLEGNKLQVDFYENGEKFKGFSVEDEPIMLAKGGGSQEFLESYAITDLGDDNYKLNFQVKEGVSVWYTYNELPGVYEVHLQEGISKRVNFVNSYIKTSNVLKINFVSHVNLGLAKRTNFNEVSINTKPKIIIY